MFHRILALGRAHLRAWRATGSFVPTAATHALMVGVLCGVLRGEVGPFPYALFAYSLTALLLTMPWFGELGFPLRSPEARDWVEALPASAVEQRIARLLMIAVMLLVLLTPPLFVATWLAPELSGWERARFFWLGAVHAGGCIALLALVQSAVAERLPSLWVGIQTLLGTLAIGGVLFLVPVFARLGHLTEAAQIPSPWRWLPPVVCAESLRAAPPTGMLGPLLAALSALLAVARLPTPAVAHAAGRRGPIDWLLAPFVRLAERTWVAPDERGPFRLVLDALPQEREFTLRTYPLLGVPLAFLWIALTQPTGPEKEGLLALLLFTPGIYLPVLASQVCASASAPARWLLETAPLPRSAIDSGALKALVLRYLLPLHLALGLVAWQQAGPRFAFVLGVPAALVSLLVLRFLYPRTVLDLPLSRPPDNAGAPFDLGGPLMGVGLGLALVAIAAERLLSTPLQGLGAVLALSLLERCADHYWRVSDVSSEHQPT